MGFFKGLSDFLLMRQAYDTVLAKRAVHSAVTKTKGRARWQWDGYDVAANTKSEARARFKAMFGLDRLPVGANVSRLR